MMDPESYYNSAVIERDGLTGEERIYTYGEEVIGVETEGEIGYYRTDEKKSVTESLDAKGN